MAYLRPLIGSERNSVLRHKENEGKNRILMRKGQTACDPLPPNKRGQTEVGGEAEAISHHFRPSESWLGGANIPRKPLSSELKNDFKFSTKGQYFLTNLAENLAWFLMI